MLFDSHTHVHFPAYDSDRNEVIKRAQTAGVKMITVGTQLSTSKSAIELAEKYSNDVWATVGFHPSHVVVGCSDVSVGATTSWYHDKNEQASAEPEEFNVTELEKLARHPKVVAIGECGLDYYRLTTDNQQLTTTKNLQKDIFIQQVELAKKVNKPMMIHCRPSKGTDDAYNDLLAAISKSQITNPKIVHFYVGSLVMTKKLMESDFYFTFGGVITFGRDYDEVIKYIPLDRILLETDAPYVAPVPYRGQRNEPAYVIEVAKKLAEIKNTTYEEVVKTITENNQRVFGLQLKL